jgi:hypothetical protein
LKKVEHNTEEEKSKEKRKRKERREGRGNTTPKQRREDR